MRFTGGTSMVAIRAPDTITSRLQLLLNEIYRMVRCTKMPPEAHDKRIKCLTPNNAGRIDATHSCYHCMQCTLDATESAMSAWRVIPSMQTHAATIQIRPPDTSGARAEPSTYAQRFATSRRHSYFLYSERAFFRSACPAAVFPPMTAKPLT